MTSKNDFKLILVIEINDKPYVFHNKKDRESYFSLLLESKNIKFFSCDSNYVTYDHFMKEIEKILTVKV